MVGVVYVHLGDSRPLLTRLLLSLYTLRRHYAGPVAVLTDQPLQLGSEAVCVPCGLNDPYEAKAALWRLMPFDAAAFLDSDTLVVGDVRPVIPQPDDERMTLVQIKEWVNTERNRSLGIGQAACLGLIHPDRAAALVDADWPACNTGVFGITKRFPHGERWERLTKHFSRHLWRDEMAMAAMMPELGRFRVLPARFNRVCNLTGDEAGGDTVIWHYTGGWLNRAASRVHCESLASALAVDWLGIRAACDLDPSMLGALN